MDIQHDNTSVYYSNDMQIELSEQEAAGSLGYINMVYARQKTGDKSLENTEICNLYESLVVWKSGVYVSGYSFHS